jgi:hypothetical protein
LVEPEDGAPFDGEKAIIRLAWSSTHTLRPDECYLITMRWTEAGAPASNQTCLQETHWFVDEAFYLRADQETDRVYFWSVRLVRSQTDEEGNDVFVPFSPSSQEWAFYWR